MDQAFHTTMNGERELKWKDALTSSRGALGFRSQLDLTFQNSILLQISSCIRRSSRTTGPPFSLDYSRNFCIADLNWSIEERREKRERGKGERQKEKEMPVSSEKHVYCIILNTRRQWNKDSSFWFSDKLVYQNKFDFFDK